MTLWECLICINAYKADMIVNLPLSISVVVLVDDHVSFIGINAYKAVSKTLILTVLLR